MAKQILFFLVVEDKEEEQQKALAAIDRAFPPSGEATNFGSFNTSHCWRHTDSGDMLVVVWLARTSVGFSEIFEIAKSQLHNGVVRHEDVMIVTDLMFPFAERRADMPNGVSVVLKAIEEDFVVAVCSDTNHHDARFFQDLLPMLSEKAAYCIPMCVDAKDWDKAVSDVLEVRQSFLDMS